MNFRVLFFIFFLNTSFSQIDSTKLKTLNKSYITAKKDSEKVMKLTEIAWLHRKFDKNKALNYCKTALALSKNKLHRRYRVC